MRKVSIKHKKTSGNFRPDRDQEPLKLKALDKLPTVPDWLSDTGKQYFNNINTILIKAGILSSCDIELIAVLAGELSRYRLAYETMQKEGFVVLLPNKYYKQSEWNGIAKESFRNASELAGKFGLTIESRAKIPEMRIEPKISLIGLMSGDSEGVEALFGHLDDFTLNFLMRELKDYIDKRKKK